MNITFSFGENWKDYLESLDEGAIASNRASLVDWLGEKQVKDAEIIDIGSGSGLSSLNLLKLGCRRLVSFDYDPHSVEATTALCKSVGEPDNWHVFEGSVLDKDLISSLGTFDIVHSWGVLHHTGSMWKAIDNASRLVKDGGLFFISIYTGGHLYSEHLKLKQDYNAADEAEKEAMVHARVRRLGGNPDAKDSSDGDLNTVYERGMNVHNDAIDWLGGLPYEVAWPSEILNFCRERGFHPLRVYQRGQGGCSEYLFEKEKREHNPKDTFLWSSYWQEEQTSRTIHEQMLTDFQRCADEASAANQTSQLQNLLAIRDLQLASPRETLKQTLVNTARKLGLRK